MKLSRSTFATGAALAVLSFAGVAQAGTPPSLIAIDGVPNASTVGQPVTITATLNFASTCPVPVVDQTNGNAPLCTANFANAAIATCVANFATPGIRTVRGTASGACIGTTTYSQTVNAVATAVPTVGEWTMWGLAGAMLIGGAAVLARRTRRFS